MKNDFVDLIFFLSSGSAFAETSSSPTAFSTDALTSRKRSISRLQRNGTYEDRTSRCVIVVCVYSEERSPLRKASRSVDPIVNAPSLGTFRRSLDAAGPSCSPTVLDNLCDN